MKEFRRVKDLLDNNNTLQLNRNPILGIRKAVIGIRKPITANNPKYIGQDYLSIDVLLERFDPLMRSIHRLFTSYNGVYDQEADCQDLWSQIQYEFIRLYHSFDPTRGVDFPGYIKFHLQNRIYHYVMKEQKKCFAEAPATAYGEDGEDKMNMENQEDLIDLEAVRSLERVEALASLDWSTVIGQKNRELMENILFKGKTLEELAYDEGVTLKVMRLRLHFACTKLIEWNNEMQDYVNFRNRTDKN